LSGNEAQEIGWLVQRQADKPRGNGWLTGPELEKLEQLRFTKRRADWRLGRWTAKRAVCAYMRGRIELAPEDVSVISDADGVPGVCFEGGKGKPAISISHSGGVGFCVVAAPDVDIGCDVETVEDRSETFISDFFTADEAKAVLSRDIPDQALFATLIWSAKESTLKALKKGLSKDTRSVVIHADGRPRRPGRLRRLGWNRLTAECIEPGRTLHGWWKTKEGQVLTIVAGGISPDTVPFPLDRLEAGGEFRKNA
jgi:4'-phosphopantetheinyl transferase